jgi:hypothetical protein
MDDLHNPSDQAAKTGANQSSARFVTRLIPFEASRMPATFTGLCSGADGACGIHGGIAYLG